MEQLKDEEVRNDINAGGRVGQLVEHAANPLFSPHRKGDVNAVDEAGLGIGHQVVDVADPLLDAGGHFGERSGGRSS